MTLNDEKINITKTYNFKKKGTYELIINLSRNLNRLDDLFIQKQYFQVFIH